jgi:hypothetical protein
MNIKEKINEIINNDPTIKKGKKINALALYTFLQLPYFKGIYKTVNILKINAEEEFMLSSDSMNAISGFTNQNASKLPIPILKEDEYEIQFIGEDEVDEIFISKDKYKSLKEFEKVLKQSENVEDIISGITLCQNNNSDFLHHCHNTMGRGYYNKFTKVLNLINSTVNFGTITSKLYKSKIYTQKKKNDNTVFSLFKKSQNIDEKTIYNDLINDYLLSSIYDDENPLEYIAENDNLFFRVVDKGDVKEKEIKKKERVKMIKSFIKEFPQSNLALFVNGDKNDRAISILNKDWDKIKKNIDEVLIELSDFKLVNNEYENNKSTINKILKEILKETPKFKNSPNTDQIKYYLIDTEYKNSDHYNEDQILISEDDYKKEYKKIESIGLSSFDYKQGLKDSLFENELNLFLYDDHNAQYEGLAFVNESLFKSNKKNTYIVAKNGSETVAMLSVHSNSNLKKLKGIGNIGVKYNYRGSDIVENLYECLAKLSIKKGWVVTNTMYTEEGKKSLPEKKQRVRDKYNDFLMIDSSYNIKRHENKSNLLSSFNSRVISHLEQKDKINLKGIKKSYDLVFESILNLTDKELEKISLSYDLEHKFVKKFIESVNKNTNVKFNKT